MLPEDMAESKHNKFKLMRYILLLLLAFEGMLFSCNSPSEHSTTPKEPIDEKFEVKKGTNVAHWLSQSDRRGIEREQFFTKKDIQNIAKMGFDHIRLPIDEVQMWDEDGKRHEDAFKLLENGINWCMESNIKVIVDLHILRSHYFNAKEKPLWTVPAEQEKFFDLWRDLSKTLKKYPIHMVAYELMNEAVADDHESWNQLVARAHKAIRELEPERTIVIGSNRWQSVDTFDKLKVPANDPNILLSFHFYEPFMLSHYKASWTFLKDYTGPVKYPGVILSKERFNKMPKAIQPELEGFVDKEFNKSALFEMWQEPIEKAKQLGLPLYCGEFGIVTDAPEQDRLIWYQDMIALFEESGIGYANWNYRSDNFGLLDGENRNEALIEIVTK